MSTEIAQKQAKILNVRVDGTQKQRVLTAIASFLAQKHKFFITTPNPEIILAAQSDHKLAVAIQKADINIPDGKGLIWAAHFLGFSTPSRVIRGREMFMDLISLANKKGWRLFLLGDDGAADAAQVLKHSFKKVNIESAAGPRLTQAGQPVTKEDQVLQNKLISHINSFKPHILFVAFGAPKQEKWTLANWNNLQVGGAMVIGGALDYVNGRAKLPPQWLAQAGFEWLWRLVNQPWRAPRIFQATVVFPIKVIISKLFSGR